MSFRDAQLRTLAIRSLLVGVCSLTPALAFSQLAPTLFDNPAGAARPAAAAGQPHVLRSRLATLRFDRLDQSLASPASSDASLVLNLFDDVVLTVTRERIEQDPLGFTSWIGRASGDPFSTVTLTQRGGVLSGQVFAHGQRFQIRSTGAGLSQIDQVDVSRLPSEVEPIPAPGRDQSPEGAGSPLGRPQATPVVDILVFYTTALANRLGADVAEARIAQAVADANTAYDRSGISGRLRLVGVAGIDYEESTLDLRDDLDNLQISEGVEAARDEVRADVVALVVDQPVNGACGIAFLGPSADFAHSVSAEPCISNYTFAHEVGHNFGSHHAPEDGAAGAWRSYGYGYKDSQATPPFRTVMAYDCPQRCDRILNFSSPLVANSDRPTGNASQDNARSLREAFPLVEVFRSADGTAPPPTPPSAPRSPQAHVTGLTVFLSWQSPTSGTVTNYRVLAGSSSGASNVFVGDVGRTTALTAPAPPGLYYVRIVAENELGSSSPSEELVVAVGGNDTIPGPPRALTAKAFGNTVRLTWSAPNVGPMPASYRVEVGSAAGATDLATFESGGPFVVQGSVPNGLYYLRVRSAGGGVVSGPSNEVSVRVGPPPGCQAPGAPSSLFFTRTGNAVSLTWTAPAAGTPPFSYVLEAGTTPGSSDRFIGNVGSSTTISSTVGAGSYFVRVRTANACGTSGPSNQVSFLVP